MNWVYFVIVDPNDIVNNRDKCGYPYNFNMVCIKEVNNNDDKHAIKNE